MTDRIEEFKDTSLAEELLPVLNHAEAVRIMVCPEGHVHIAVEDYHVTLSPEDAEDWVGKIYDAAQAAKEIDDD